MALVAYDSSDCSDNEDDGNVPDNLSNVEAKSTFSQDSKCETVEISQKTPLESASVGRSALFANLPSPKSLSAHIFIPESDGDTLPVSNKKEGKWGETKEVKPVKIVIPSLSELIEDEPSNKKPRMSKGKGLFSVLPLPKHSAAKVTNRPLIPHSVKPKGAPPKIQHQKQSSKEQCKKSLTDNAKSSCTTNDSDDDNLDETLDFFSLESVGKIPDVDAAVIEEPLVPDTGSVNTSESACKPVFTNVPENYNHDACSTNTVVHEVSDLEASGSAGSSFSDLSSLMSDEGFLRLGGTKKRGKQDIQFIDVAQDDQLPSTEEWMRKALMEETGYRPSRKKGFMPTAQQRRKHQITYLAFQAKERELELQEQWAQNRFTRHQTQSKYGF